MSASLIYRSAKVYELVMRILYGRHYDARSRAIADLIPDGSSVVELCCGPGHLFERYLRSKSVDYLGLDINPRFVEEVERRGGHGSVWDLKNSNALPSADFVIMQASLYHFLPDPLPVLNRMLSAARRKVIVAEPVRNLADSNWKPLALIGQSLTNAGSGAERHRFNEATLAQLMKTFEKQIERAFLIPGGREKVYVLKIRDISPTVSRDDHSFIAQTKQT